jgi:hypothetical protein
MWVGLCLRRGQPSPVHRLLLPPPPAITTQPPQMLRLDRNSLNTEGGEAFVKMSANFDVVRTCDLLIQNGDQSPHAWCVDVERG